jgi:hypothetical protein
MKKSLGIIFALSTLFAVVPNALALTKAFQVNAASGGTLTTGLVSYWNMQGNSNDYYGSNNGTDTSVSYGTSYGKVAQGANFGGSAYSDMGNVIDQSGSSPFSIAAWFKTIQTGNSALVGKEQNATSPYLGYMLGIGDTTGNAGKVDFIIETTASSYIWKQVTTAYNDGNWHLAIATYSGNQNVSGIILYVDGTAQSTTQSSVTTITGSASNSFPFQIGARQGTDNYIGSVDEVGFWSKALSTQEITDLYNGGAGQTMCNGTGGPLCGKHKIILISLNWKPEPIT